MLLVHQNGTVFLCLVCLQAGTLHAADARRRSVLVGFTATRMRLIHVDRTATLVTTVTRTHIPALSHPASTGEQIGRPIRAQFEGVRVRVNLFSAIKMMDDDLNRLMGVAAGGGDVFFRFF